ncbi:hypothetical protein [Leptospira interrogans]|uniref:hypothetical protein n=1 Tax=Leptospira interrogans TaxID=173 RepID=UPI00027858B8|nr:hypothetical protein [Leptospira interrogans]EJP16517.1 hypothetical protein LEP1GSC080_0643 [Leptospira interrogans str. FPW2026]
MSGSGTIIIAGVYITNLENPTWNKLDNFATFKDGWNFGEGKAFEYNVLSSARYMLSDILYTGFTITDAFPGIDGEVRLTIYHNRSYLEFTINESLFVDFVLEENDNVIEEKQNLSFNDALNLISKFWNDTCKPLESSMSDYIMINKGNVSNRLRLKAQRESLSSIKSAPSGNLEKYAVISQSFIRALQVIL